MIPRLLQAPSWHASSSAGPQTQVSIQTRYPNLEGKELQTRLFRDWLLLMDDTRLPFLDVHGRETLSRHPLNREYYETLKESYVTSIMETGLMEGVRGQAWAVPVPNEKERWFLIAHATLVEAVYAAYKRDPQNRYVQATMTDGVVAKVFRPDTPHDVLLYLRHLHNFYHKGASTTHLEILETIGPVMEGWSKHCEREHIRARKMPTNGPRTYAKLYWEWLTANHKGAFRSFAQFLEAKTFVTGMKRAELWHRHVQDLVKNCDFTHAGFDVSVAITASRDLFCTIRENFVDTIPEVHLKEIIMLALQMTYARQTKPGQDDPMWIFSSKASLANVRMLLCPMGGSAVYLRAHKHSMLKQPKSMGNGKGGKHKEKGKPPRMLKRKRSGRGNGGKCSMNKRAKIEMKALKAETLSAFSPILDKGGDDKCKVPDVAPETETDEDAVLQAAGSQPSQQEAPAPPEEEDVPFAEEKAQREKLFLDDVYACIDSVMQHLPQDHWIQSSLTWAYRQALTFAFTKSGFDECEQTSSWSAMREAIKDRLAADHRGHLPSKHALTDNLPSQIVSQIRQAQVDHKQRLVSLFSDATQNQAVADYMTENDFDLPVMNHPGCFKLTMSTFKTCTKQKTSLARPMTPAEVIIIVAEHFKAEGINAHLENWLQPLKKFCLTQMGQCRSTSSPCSPQWKLQ